MPQFSAPESTQHSAPRKLHRHRRRCHRPNAPSGSADSGAREAIRAARGSSLAMPRTAKRRHATRRSNSAKRRESDQAATAPSERKQAAVPAPPDEAERAAPSTSAVNAAPAAQPAPRVTEAPSVLRRQDEDARLTCQRLKKRSAMPSAGLQAAGRQDQAARCRTYHSRCTHAMRVGRVAPAPSVAQQRQRASRKQIEIGCMPGSSGSSGCGVKVVTARRMRS